MNTNPVILFDGVCNLCNGAVRFMLPRDPDGVLRFASLQSDYGQSQLASFDLPQDDFDSFVLVEGERHYTRSTAALRALGYLNFPWNLARFLIFVPRFIRDVVYDWVARNRYAWFGVVDVCPLPTPEQQARFLS
ncbi:MAG: thiol-disulfide oxidoreductase DCC family protein [Chloroflexi bacterium]|nr:MAG: thiol-disulfide oxidoreductase DCC family protein [Chloroflexota bacterium]MBL1196822.1 thiol-disulfide oxidoreductase DCC family protein [Chloroflexota bacterium]NOH14117.1 thiol-disulfide oxidoreductase DCC family protein [Chloroflexota bacterium]